MAGRSKYTDDDRARVATALHINDGNIKRTARETGIPENTVRDWKRAWEKGGLPATVEQAQQGAVDEFVDQATHIRNLYLRRLEELVETETNARNVATVVGILDDKLVRAAGKPTSRTEQVGGLLPSPEEFKAALTGWAIGAVQAANERRADIIEVQDVEQLD